MQGAVLCVTTGNPLTSPQATHMENGRIFHYPLPGTIVRYRADEEVVRQDVSVAPEDSPVSRTFQWVPGDVRVGFGVMIFEDYLEKRLKDEVIPLEAGTKEFMLEPKRGDERAKDFAIRWRNYGALLIKGGTPTEAEFEQAKGFRQQYALRRLTEVTDWQSKRRGGMKGIKPTFDPSDRAWAKEFGVALVETLELLPRLPQNEAQPEKRVPCPECGEQIVAQAKVCHYCKKKFQMPVEQFIAQPAETEVAQ